MSKIRDDIYYVRRWKNPDAEWGDHERVEAWDYIEAAEGWITIEQSLRSGADLKKLQDELTQGINLQVRHVATGSEQRMKAYMCMVPQYNAVHTAWNGSGEERLEPM